MKLRVSLLFSICILLSSNVLSQERQLRKGDENYNNLAYAVATKYYLKALKKGYTSPDIYKKLGNSYYYNSNYKDAFSWYEKLFQTTTDIEPEYYFKYAQTLRSQDRYEEANTILQKFQELNPTDSRAQLYKNSPNYLDSIKTQTSLYNVKNLDINSPESDFGPALLQQNLIYTSARDTGVFSKFSHKWSGKEFLDLYSVPEDDLEIKNVERFSKNINSKYHESTSVFTKDGNTIYFTRNNLVDGKRRKDRRGTTRLKIYRATYVDGEWTNIEELPFNNDEYSVAHPALSPDETKLYFASDMPGSYGMSDLYVVDINPDGTFGTPRNLGPSINTESRESFPYVSEHNNLYFASDGHLGLGGLDIFVYEIEGNNAQVVNLGKPVNSPFDDFTFVINDDTKMGYFASNRGGGKGSDDIYVFEIGDDFIICQKLVAGVITNIETGEVLKDAQVSLIAENKDIEEIVTNENGEFSFLVECEEDEKKLLGTKIGFFPKEEIVMVNKDSPDTIKVDIKLIKQLETPVGGYDLAKLIKLNPIYFNFDKFNIRPDAQKELNKIAEVLINNPDLLIDIKSHTDSRGSDQYNQQLSEKRAQSTLEYIKTRGIGAIRLTAKGYGESQLLNECEDGVNCSRHQHQLNRRSEFIISNEEIYTVQIAAVKNEPNLNAYDVENLFSYQYDDGLHRVYSGMFDSEFKAQEHLEKLKQEGVDGFIRKLYIETNKDADSQLINDPRFKSVDVSAYTLQVAALASNNKVSKYRKLPAMFSKSYEDGYVRIYSGDFKTKAEAQRALAQLQQRGISGFVREIKGKTIIE
jgi:outer membrane protein OmpA-like peptidoglycan-associated protein/tetratricopeptide (TPR) repeat protein